MGSLPNNEKVDVQIGSNRPGPHPASDVRPVHHPEWEKPLPSGYSVSNHMIGEVWPPNKDQAFKIVVMGAGAAGIDFLHHAIAGLADLNIEIKCFEKNRDVGGTWFENRYPGCACDGPSATYQFPWRPNPDWTRFYSGSKEIWEYLKAIATDEDMYKYITLNTTVINATWNETRAKWVLVLEHTDKSRRWEEECDLFLNGAGFLNDWKWPSIPGLDSFKGDMFHTANYTEGYDLKNKRVAVIGSGSSGVQTVASVYPDVAKLYTWVRSPTWITAGFAQKFAGEDGGNFSYSEVDKLKWRSDPEEYRRYRKAVENEMNTRFKTLLRNSAESQEAALYSHKEMCRRMGHDDRLIDKIIPKDFNVGCRRPTPGEGYLEALVAPKTTVFTETIGKITPNGFTDSEGKEYECDVIICATGFDTSFRPRFPIIGREGLYLDQLWASLPRSYLGIAAPKMPNYFMFTGPFIPVAQGSVLPILSQVSQYLIRVIRKMQKQHIRAVVPKDSAIADFMEHSEAYMPRTCWGDPCRSWFKQGRKDGNIVMWPGSRLAFFDAIEDPQWEDFDIEYYSKNRFGYFGSGFTKQEFDPNGDFSTYLNHDFKHLPVKSDLEAKLSKM